MTFDDFKRLLTGPALFRLDAGFSARLVPILYATGLGTLLIWAVRHFITAFASNFADGLWSLVEIGVFGVFLLALLRIGCEALLVFFKANEASARAAAPRVASTLVEDLRETIRDMTEPSDPPLLALDPVEKPSATADAPATPTRRTARRTPKLKS